MVGWTEQEIKERNRQLSRLADSRKEIFVEARQEYRKELAQLVVRLIKFTLPKGEKEDTLRRVRELEALTGVDVGDYNSPDFGNVFKDVENNP